MHDQTIPCSSGIRHIRFFWRGIDCHGTTGSDIEPDGIDVVHFFGAGHELPVRSRCTGRGYAIQHADGSGRSSLD